MIDIDDRHDAARALSDAARYGYEAGDGGFTGLVQAIAAAVMPGGHYTSGHDLLARLSDMIMPEGRDDDDGR